MKHSISVLLTLFIALSATVRAEPIDRKAVVSRHDISINATYGILPTQVGNGKFAFGMDISGLQTFTAFNTLSDWGWYSSPRPEGEYHTSVIESYGRDVTYWLDDPDNPELSQWLKVNPNRINLGRMGFILLGEDGSPVAAESELENATQTVTLWTGIVNSRFSLGGVPVSVRTSCHPDRDIVAVSVDSPLMKEGRLKIFFDFPGYDGEDFAHFIGSYDNPESHTTAITAQGRRSAEIEHKMDSTEYRLALHWKGKAEFSHEIHHKYLLTPAQSHFEFTGEFVQGDAAKKLSARRVERASAAAWEYYWTHGAAVDFSGSTDPRWEELESRVVRSQYVMRINESGLFPPQEAGLVNNGWNGRFHWEMVWWHAAHWYLWDRGYCADEIMNTYSEFLPAAIERARAEGRKGARWPKCTGNINREWPCDVHSFLCWQQPHPIWFAEMEYRNNPSQTTLDKWAQVVVNTADYLADYPFWDGKRYVLGAPVAPVSENTDYLTTVNPIFELGYFRYGLRTALQWAERLGLPKERTAAWRNTLDNLAELPQEDGLYKTAESVENMWEEFNFEHPALTGVYGWLPGDGVDIEIFRRTFYKVLECWEMDRCWGWDYPMLAMAAARLGDSAKAVDLLCTTAHKYAFDPHGLMDAWPEPYFPANGGLLTAVAMMCAGWDGGPDNSAPGFPEGWSVKFEGLKKMQ